MFDSLELGAIDILINKEILICKNELKNNNFTYKEDKISYINFLKTLENIHNKINKK